MSGHTDTAPQWTRVTLGTQNKTTDCREREQESFIEQPEAQQEHGGAEGEDLTPTLEVLDFPHGVQVRLPTSTMAVAGVHVGMEHDPTLASMTSTHVPRESPGTQRFVSLLLPASQASHPQPFSLTRGLTAVCPSLSSLTSFS